MSLKPKRKNSKELPPKFSELMKQLEAAAASFIQQFDRSESRMKEIVGEFLRISEEIKDMQRKTDLQRTVGAVTAVAGLGGLIVAAAFTGGLSLIVAAAAAGGGAVGGGAAVVSANVTKMMSENRNAQKIEKLGKDLMNIVEPMQVNLEEIKTTCEKLEERSDEAQAGNALTDTEELQTILRRVSELKKKSRGVLVESVTVLQAMGELVQIMVTIFRVTATPEADKKLGDAIIKSADQSKKVVKEFEEMKTDLTKFRAE